MTTNTASDANRSPRAFADKRVRRLIMIPCIALAIGGAGLAATASEPAESSTVALCMNQPDKICMF